MRPSWRWSIVAVVVAAVTAFVSSAADPIALIVSLVSCGIAWGRGARWSWARWLDRPRLFSGIALLYMPLFGFDLLMMAQFGQPIPALARLIAFLLLVESATGDTSSDLRLLLLGWLLVIASAGMSAELSFSFGLIAYLACAGIARFHATFQLAPRRQDETPMRWRWSIPLVSAVGAATVLLFVLTPHFGTNAGGFGRALPGALSTGLAENVELGMIGRVKKNREIVFRAQFADRDFEPNELYWRARVYETWTGDGWQRGLVTDDRIRLRAGLRAELPTDMNQFTSGRTVQATVTLTTARPLSALPVPGTPTHITSSRDAAIRASADGTLTPVGIRGPRQFDIEVEWPEGERAPGAATFPVPPLGDRGTVPQEVEQWAESIAPETSDPLMLSRAFVQQLRGREYSLDTSAIDPERPIASFLDGAPGHCEYFASSMALALRSRGVQARVVGGYLGGEPSPFNDELLVRESNAHLWVESFIPGRGWTRFDPTPAEGRVAPPMTGGPILAWSEAVVLLWDTWVIGFDFEDQWQIAREIVVTLVGFVRRFGVPLALLVALALLMRWIVRLRLRRREPSTQLYEEFLRALSRHGVHARPDEGPAEIAARAKSNLGATFAPLVDSITGAYLESRFGRAEPQADWRELRGKVRQLARVAPNR